MKSQVILCALALILAACSGSDPKTLTDEGRAALGRGDAKSALAEFDEALLGLDPSHEDYLRASFGRCEALAQMDGSLAMKSFLELAAKVPAKVSENDYGMVGDALWRGDFKLEAIDVVDAGKKRFPESKAMDDMLNSMIAAAKKQDTPDALNKLKGMGYAGD